MKDARTKANEEKGQQLYHHQQGLRGNGVEDEVGRRANEGKVAGIVFRESRGIDSGGGGGGGGDSVADAGGSVNDANDDDYHDHDDEKDEEEEEKEEE
ncbi:hypothetical protein M0802_008701 [Mischocyttarus mexicanus]|nr:hypothetical protein M0802_008701 [Mischocyttarus mexicanus]